jgi:hypothetical protein
LFRPTHFASGFDAPFGFAAGCGGAEEAACVDALIVLAEELAPGEVVDVDAAPGPGEAVDAVGSTEGPEPAGLLDARDADPDADAVALGGGAAFFFATNFESFGNAIGV